MKNENGLKVKVRKPFWSKGNGYGQVFNTL
jgi:hypothetical protein